MRRLAPGPLLGITFARWVRLLRDNRFDVDAQGWPRAMTVTVCSLLNTAVAWLEEIIFADKYRGLSIPPPLFVLGAPRSGTTFLYHLLTRDHRFAFPNLYQIRNPHTFLTTEPVITRLTASLISGTRLQDNVRMSWQTPEEDEFAVLLYTLKTPLLWMFFPRNRKFYERFRTFEAGSGEEVREWKEALLTFLRKLTWKNGRPLILKSPIHLGRVRLLLELFPEAKFAHIVRHPYDVYRSALHTREQVRSFWSFQRSGEWDPISVWSDAYSQTYEAFFRDRERIPAGHLCDLRFEDLERDPVNGVERIYQDLALPDFRVVEGAVANYVRQTRGYERNVHAEISAAAKRRIAEGCRRNFEEWGYVP